MQPSPQAGPASGLAQVLEEQRPALLQFLAARCGSADEAQDLLQDLWIKVSAQSTGPIANPRAYLFRMANNLALDNARGRQRSMRREHAWIEAEHGGAVQPPEDRADPTELADEAIARKQEADILRRAIDGLPEGARRALRLYRFDGLGQGEIAKIMGISRSGVEKHLALAMKRLREALLDCGCLNPATSTDRGAEGGDASQMEQGR